jgi:hypothetical protein
MVFVEKTSFSSQSGAALSKKEISRSVIVHRFWFFRHNACAANMFTQKNSLQPQGMQTVNDECDECFNLRRQ